MHKIKRIMVLFVEPMLYNMDLIHEVYEKTEYDFFYIYCDVGLTGKDRLTLPENSFVCSGAPKERKAQICQQADAFNPDFAVINGYVGTEQVALIQYCQKNGIPYAIESDTQLNIPSNPIKAFLKKAYLKKLLHHDLCYGFPGGTLQKENLVYYGIPENRNFIMPMCVSEYRLLNEFERLPSKDELKKRFGVQDKFTYLFVGRLEEVKNVRLLIESYELVKKENKDIALIIVGNGSLRESLERFVTENNIEDVIFSGYIVFPEIVKYYKASDVFVLPSSYEPWGLVVNEAMIMGLPVIASTDVGCRVDLIDDGKNGYVFESRSRSELAKKMNIIQNDDYTYLTFSAKQKTKEWSFNKYLNSFTGAIRNADKSER